MSIKTIKADSSMQRILLIVIGLVFLLFVFFTAKWFLGNSISKRVIQKEVADLAITLAPNDPQTHFAKGVLLEKSFQPEDLAKSLEEYEKAVALSPNDFRLWVAYGKAKERNGDSEGAEKALLKALELAPNYASVQWAYGNVLLRQDKTKEAFEMIRKAVQSDSKFASPAATTAWSIFEGDIDEVKKAVGDSDPVKSALATFLAGQERFGDALEIWNELPEKERKTTFLKDGESIINKLISKKKYRTAMPLKSMLAENASPKMEVGEVTDGGFEGVLNTKPDIFEWKVVDGNKPVIGLNTEQKKSGEKSLAIIFNSSRGKDFRTVSQNIAVESGVNYEFEVFYRSNLETSATLKWEIVDATDGQVIATTDAIEAGSSDWKSSSVSFKTPVDCEGITLRLMRENCTSADCSIKGTVWFDDISLN